MAPYLFLFIQIQKLFSFIYESHFFRTFVTAPVTVSLHVIQKGKSKVIPLQAQCGPEGG